MVVSIGSEFKFMRGIVEGERAVLVEQRTLIAPVQTKFDAPEDGFLRGQARCRREEQKADQGAKSFHTMTPAAILPIAEHRIIPPLFPDILKTFTELDNRPCASPLGPCTSACAALPRELLFFPNPTPIRIELTDTIPIGFASKWV